MCLPSLTESRQEAGLLYCRAFNNPAKFWQIILKNKIMWRENQQLRIELSCWLMLETIQWLMPRNLFQKSLIPKTFILQSLEFLMILYLQRVNKWMKLKDSTTFVPLKLKTWKNTCSKTLTSHFSLQITTFKLNWWKIRTFNRLKFLEQLILKGSMSTTITLRIILKTS